MNHLNEILALAAPPGGEKSPSGPQSLLASPIVFIVLMVIMMYFLLIRPQQKRAKQQAELIKNLKSGDKVVTSSGIVGMVITVKDKTVTLRSADTKMEVTKASVGEILESSGSTES